jgi:hypothetical protein
MHLEKARFSELIENPEMLSAREKKWRRFKNMLGNAKSNTVQGAMIGTMVGGYVWFNHWRLFGYPNS